MTDTARLLLTTTVLSIVALGTFLWRLLRTDPGAPDRLIGEFRLAQAAALLLAASGAVSIGFGVAAELRTGANLDVAIGATFVLLAGFVLTREPREALFVAAAAFLFHAVFNLSHRPGWLSTDLAPRWFAIGSAIYDGVVAAACYVGRRR